MAKVGVLGAGTWGTALARMLCNSGHDVVLWSALEREVTEYAKTRRHPNLPGMIIPDAIRFTGDIEDVLKDKDILLLGGLYAALAVCYLFFEKCIINYRPVILDEGLEASFPSSHTMLAMCLMLAAMEQLRRRLKDQPLGRILSMVCAVLLVVTVIGRLLSGVHWLTDILGGLLLGGALYLFYAGLIDLLRQRGRI